MNNIIHSPPQRGRGEGARGPREVREGAAVEVVGPGHRAVGDELRGDNFEA